MSQRDFLREFALGRSGRMQFWSFYVLFALPSAGFAIAGLPIYSRWRETLLALANVWGVALIVPVTFAMARRFHDIGWRGLWAIPQLCAIFFAFIVIVTFPTLFRPDMSASCLLPHRLLNLTPIHDPANRPPLLSTPEQDAVCEADRAARARYDAQQRSASLAVTGLATALHLATLALMARNSQPGPNPYGPNPTEVIE